MDQPNEHVSETLAPSEMLTSAFDIVPPAAMPAMDEQSASELHRAINERRAQMENPELLRHLRSL